MAAGSNPRARPLVFATQAGSAVSGSAHTSLISGSHRALLITLLTLCGARTDRKMDIETDRQTGFTSQLKKKPEHQVTAADMLSTKRAPVVTAPPTNPHTHTRNAVMHILRDNHVYTHACWCCSPSRSVSDSSIIITVQKVKHRTSSLFFAIYVFVLLSFVQINLHL